MTSIKIIHSIVNFLLLYLTMTDNCCPFCLFFSLTDSYVVGLLIHCNKYLQSTLWIYIFKIWHPSTL